MPTSDGRYTLSELAVAQEADAAPIRSGEKYSLWELGLGQVMTESPETAHDVDVKRLQEEIARWGLDGDPNANPYNLPEEHRLKIQDVVMAKPQHVQSLRNFRQAARRAAAAPILSATNPNIQLPGDEDSALTGELGELEYNGSKSTELSITIEDERINGRKPTNIPLLVHGQVDVEDLLAGNSPTETQVELATRRAIERVRTGKLLPSYKTTEEAEDAAEKRSDDKGKIGYAGPLKHLVHPAVETFRDVYHAPMRMRLKGLTKEIVDAEAKWRLAHGFYDPETDIGKSSIGLDTGEVTKLEYTPENTNVWEDPSEAKNNRWFREQIRRDLFMGVPMLSPENDGKIELLFEELMKVSPEEIPNAKTLIEKIASVGGNVGLVVAEYALARRILSTGGLSDRLTGTLKATPGLRAATKTGIEFGAIDLAHGRDPAEGMQTGLGMGAFGAGGSALARGTKTAQQTAKTMVTAGRVGEVGGHAAFFGAQAKAHGADWADALIVAAVAPIAFKARDFLARKFSPREALRLAKEDWQNAPSSWRGLHDSQHKSGQLIYRMGRLAERGGDKAEAESLVREMQKLYEGYEKADWKGVSTSERAILENFVDSFSPTAVRRRARQAAEQAVEQETETVQPIADPSIKVTKPATPPPAITRHKVGDSQSIAGKPAAVVDVEPFSAEGTEWELYAHQEGGGASIRVIDVDAGEVVSIKHFKTLDEASDELNDAIRKQNAAAPIEPTVPGNELSLKDDEAAVAQIEEVKSEADNAEPGQMDITQPTTMEKSLKQLKAEKRLRDKAAKAALPRAKPRTGIGKAKADVVEIFNRRQDVIVGDEPGEGFVEGDMVGVQGDFQAGDMTYQRPSYSFRADGRGVGEAKEMKAALEKYGLGHKIQIVKPGHPAYAGADGADAMTIGTDQMIESVLRFARRNPKELGLDVLIADAIENPLQYSPEELYRIQKYRTINQSPEAAEEAKGAVPSLLSTFDLSEGDTYRVAGQVYQVDDVSEEWVDISGPFESMSLPRGDIKVAIDNGSWSRVDPNAPRPTVTRDLDSEFSVAPGENANAIQPYETEVERVRREAGEAQGNPNVPFAFSPGFFGPGKPRRPAVDVPGSEFPDPAVRERMRRNWGIPEVPLLEWIKDIANSAWHKATRAREHVPNNARFAVANEVLRLWNDTPGIVARRVQEDVSAILHELNSSELTILEGAIQADNIIASLQQGLGLPFGISSEKDVLKWRENLQAIIDEPTNSNLRAALENRKAIVIELTTELVKNDLLPAEAIDRAATYYHQQVMGYAALDGYGKRAGLKRTKASFQKRRTLFRDEETDEFYDWNTSFIESETKWMTEARTKLAAKAALNMLAVKYDIAKRLKADATRMNYVNFVGGPKTMARIDEIRDILSSAREGAIELDRTEAKLLSGELWDLDKTMPFRRKIAMASAKIQKAIENGELDRSAFGGMETIDENQDDLGPRWFELLRYLSTQDPDGDLGIAARSIFKAIYDRSKMISDALGKKERSWEDLIPDGYKSIQPENGNVLYHAYTIPERIAEFILRDIGEEIKIAPSEVQRAIVLGGRRSSYVMPEEIVLTLEDLERPSPRGDLAIAARDAMGVWKGWSLFKPRSFLPYEFRNFSGDVDPVIGGAAGALPYVPKWMNELWRYYYGNPMNQSDRLKDMIKYAVLSSTMRRQELPKLKELSLFRRFYAHDEMRLRDLPAKTLGLYMDAVGKFNEFREGMLRAALFDYAMDIWESGREINHYGASKKAVVDAIREDMGNAAAAAHYSRNFVGDYGNLTALGQWMREHAMPFWSFQEIVTKRYPRMLINTYEYGKAKGKGRAWAQAAHTAFAASGLVLPFAVLWMWNNLYRKDEEDDHGRHTASNPHINMGRKPDGNPRVFTNVGSLGEFLEWLGGNTFLSRYDAWRTGQISGKDLAWEMFLDPVNKIAQGVRPDVKVVAELFSGQTSFPDVTSWRRQMRDESIPRAWGVLDEYRWLKGKILKEGDRPRKYYAERHLWGVSDFRQNALFAMYDFRERYLKSIGNENRGDAIYGISPMRNMRQAAIDENYEAFKEGRAKYLLSRDYKSFRASLRFLDPISQKLKAEDEIKFEDEFLNDRQRPKLKVARDYAKELEIRLWRWWQQAATEEGSDQGAAQAEAVKTELRPKLRTMSRIVPLRPDERAKYDQEVRDAISYLNARQITRDEAYEQFTDDLDERIKGWDKRSRTAKRGHKKRFRKIAAKLDK